MQVWEKIFYDTEYKIPTGIKTVDLALDGGFPGGSLVMLGGKPGVGKLDFWHTIAYKNAAIKEGVIPAPEMKVRIPENIWFLSLKNSKEDILTDIRMRYSKEFFELYSKYVNFKDFIPEYFSMKRSIFESGDFSDKTELEFAPPSVFSRVVEKASVDGKEPEHIFEITKNISDFIRSEAKGSIVMVESLNELVRIMAGDERSLLSSLLFLRRENSTRWGSVIYTYLSEGVFAKHMEEAVSGTVDNVLSFEGESVTGSWNVMKIRKFKGHPSGTLAKTRYEIYPTINGVEVMKVDLLEA